MTDLSTAACASRNAGGKKRAETIGRTVERVDGHDRLHYFSRYHGR